jgi:hypothetical protein
LSTEGLRVEAVTELGDGLAGGFNNRAYLRVTTPDGRALPATEIEVSNPWQVDQPGVKAVTDADGVASLQLDPGEPVTVVIPAPPVRARPEPVRPPELRAAVDLEVGGTASAELRRAAELAHPAVATCAALSGGGDVQAALTVQISPVGVTTGVVSADPMGACVGDAMRAVRWPAGSTRTLRLLWHLYDPPEDYVDVRVDQGTSSIAGLQPWAEQLRGAVRACVARHQIEGLDLRLHWRARKGSAGLDVQPSSGLPGEAAACLRAAWSVPMDEPASADGLGVVHLTQRERVAPGQLQAQAQTRMAYELLVQANGAQGRVILPVGQLPDLRIRVEPGLVLPGETVVATMLRGPGFVGELPEHLYLTVAGREVGKAPVRKESRTASFEIPADLRGVATVSWGSAEGLIFVRDPKPLGVQLSSDAASYRPGQQASVRVKTTAGGEPVSAGVGLIGVDAALGQLATLPGPDALGEAFVQLQAARPAFAKFTPAALALGQIKGEHAARAALLRVTGVSARTEQEAGVSGEASTTLEARAELAEAFYEVYEVLLAVVVQWEKSAPEGELMSPPRMVGLWEQALAQVEDRQGRTTDAFGRRLELEVLPDDLLQELDPHRLVSQGTRLSEDVIDWVRFVREETR